MSSLHFKNSKEGACQSENDAQHGQAGSAVAAPKFCSVALRKTSAVPGTVSGNLLDDIRHYNARSKAAAVRAAKNRKNNRVGIV